MVILVSWKFKNPGERSDWSVDSVAVGKCVIWLAVKTCAEIGYANNLKHDYRKDAFSMTSSLSFTLSLCFLQCKLRGLYIHQVVASFWVTEIREWEIESKYTRIREAQRAHAPRVSRIFWVSRENTVVKRLHMWEQYCGTTSWSEVVWIKLSHKSWKQAHKLVSPYIYILWRQTVANRRRLCNINFQAYVHAHFGVHKQVNNTYAIRRPGRSVLEETVPEVLSTPRGLRPRAVLKT